MARLLSIHPSRSAIDREADEALLAELRSAGLEIESCQATPGLSWLDRQLAICEGVVLIDPIRWWPRSTEDHLRRPWISRITAHVEFDRRNRLGAVAGIGSRIAPTNPELAGIRWFRQRGDEVQALRDWASAIRDPTEPFDFAIDSVTAGQRLRSDLLMAIDARLARSSTLAITGPIGSGKTRLLRDWLGCKPRQSRRAFSAGERSPTNEWIVAHHFALPEHGSTQRATLAARSLARQLHPPATTLHAALIQLAASKPQMRIVLLVDGLEHIDDPRVLFDSVPDGHHERVRWLVGARPGSVPSDTPTIDLAAPSWTSTPELIEALAGEITRLDPDEREALARRAAGNLGYVAALAEDAGTRTTKIQLKAQTVAAVAGLAPTLPRRFESELARALGRLTELPLAARRRGDRILGLLALAGEPMPAAILLECLAAETESLESVIQPVRDLLGVAGSADEPTLALYHPALGDLLRFELDAGAIDERSLFEGIERAVANRPGVAVKAFEAKHGPLLRRKLGAVLGGWLGDVEKLVEYARNHGPLQLERELAVQCEGAVEDLLTIVRARQAALVGVPEALPEILWNGLLDRGWSSSELNERLRWPSKPLVRLRRALEHTDRCWRSLSHPDDVHACAISSDGKLVLSGCDDGRLRLWSRTSGEELAVFEHGSLIRSCAMTPDGRWAVSGGTDHRIKLWDLQARKAAGEYKLGLSTIAGLAIDDQGQRVLAGDDRGRVLIWRPVEDSAKQLGVHDERLAGVAIASSGKIGLSGGKLDVVIWDLDGNRQFAKLPNHEYTIGGIALGSDGRRGYSVAIGESRQIGLASGKVERTYGDLGKSVDCCVAIGQGDQLLVGIGQRLGIWDMVAGEIKHAIHAHADTIEGCATTPDASWVVSAGTTQLKIWPRAAFECPSAARWTNARSIVAASPDGTLAIVGGDEYELSIVDVASGRITGKLEVGSRTNAVAWIDDDRLLTVGATSHEIAVWSVARRNQLAMRELGSDWLRSCAISPDRRRALIVGDQKRTWLVDLDNIERDSLLGSHADWIHACRFSSDGELALAADGDGELLIWSVADRKRRHKLKSDSNYSYAALATIGDLAFAGGPSALDVWDIDDGVLLNSSTLHKGKIYALALADEGRVLISAGEDATLRLWKVGRSPSLLTTLVGHAPFTSLSLAGPLLLAGDAAGNVWELLVDWRSLGG